MIRAQLHGEMSAAAPFLEISRSMVSFGVYYKSVQGKSLLKAFIKKMREAADL